MDNRLDPVIKPLAQFTVAKKNLNILDNKLNKIITNVDKKLEINNSHLDIANKLVDDAILDLYKLLSK